MANDEILPRGGSIYSSRVSRFAFTFGSFLPRLVSFQGSDLIEICERRKGERGRDRHLLNVFHRGSERDERKLDLALGESRDGWKREI